MIEKTEIFYNPATKREGKEKWTFLASVWRRLSVQQYREKQFFKPSIWDLIVSKKAENSRILFFCSELRTQTLLGHLPFLMGQQVSFLFVKGADVYKQYVFC